MSRGIHFVTTHVAISMAACMSSLGALGAWTPENKAALKAQIGTYCIIAGVPSSMVGPAPDNEPISDWDVSKVTDMSYLFNYCEYFNDDISGWETSQVTTFNEMFHYAQAFNQPLGSWNTESVTNFRYVFYSADAFNQPLDSWNTEKGTNFNRMFYSADAFNQPLNMWKTEKATDFDFMFKDATAFNQPLDSWNTEKGTDFNRMFEGTKISIDTTAYWDTTNARSGKYLSPPQPCPDGYSKGTAPKGTLAVRCPGGCSVTGYYVDANGFCRNDCFVDHCEDCTTDRETTCDTCTGGYAQYAGSAACVEIKVCSTATGGQCLVCKNVNECEAGQCNPGYQFDAQCTACPNPGIGEKLTTTAGACTVTPCPVVGVYYYGDYYYTTAGDCTKIQNCPSLGDNEEYVTGVVLTSPTGCKKCSSPGIGQKFISPSPSPGACTVTPCPVVAGEYYIEGTEECTTTSCTNRDTSTQYYDKQEVIIEDDCSVATCPTGKTPAANGLSCVDELKEKEKEAASDSNSPMVGAIVGSVVGVLVLVAVAGILVWVFVIRPRRL